MSSVLHEVLVSLFRERKMLAAELLACSGRTLPSFREARVEDATLTQIVPAEYRADLVTVLADDAKAVLAIIVEVQLTPDSDKRYSWPLYLTAVRARHRCPAVVLVITPEAELARRLVRPIDLGPGSHVTPVVIGPAATPWCTKDDPTELRILSCLAHVNEDGGVKLFVELLPTLTALDEERARLYFDVIMAALSEGAKEELEKMVTSGKYEYQSDFAKTYFAKGLKKGREEGREEGRIEGRAHALIAIARAKGIELSPQGEQRILACRDDRAFERWLERVPVARTEAELFEGDD